LQIALLLIGETIFDEIKLNYVYEQQQQQQQNNHEYEKQYDYRPQT